MPIRPHPRERPGDPLRYGEMDSPMGRIHVAVSPGGVCRVSLRSRTEDSFLGDLARRYPGPVKAGGRLVESVLEQLHRYFEGRKRTFTCPVDLTGRTDFQTEVLEATRKIPFGSTWSYRGLAEKMGRPRAWRAVGNALGRNPVPILVPCHRVVASDGSLGGFTGGIHLKKYLLRHEGLRRHGETAEGPVHGRPESAR